jgi:hypothetical protein
MDRKGLAILLLAVVILLLLFAPKSSSFGAPSPISGYNVGNSHPTTDNVVYQRSVVGAGIPSTTAYDGDVSSASLIPREVVQTEDFGQFSPDKIMSGQNYLDPRSQIGYPETVGGVLRNANQQFRSEPINPRTPVSIFNLSTIPPDTMRPKFEISPEYQ